MRGVVEYNPAARGSPPRLVRESSHTPVFEEAEIVAFLDSINLESLKKHSGYTTPVVNTPREIEREIPNLRDILRGLRQEPICREETRTLKQILGHTSDTEVSTPPEESIRQRIVRGKRKLHCLLRRCDGKRAV
jgi:hypothetical protein